MEKFLRKIIQGDVEDTEVVARRIEIALDMMSKMFWDKQDKSKKFNSAQINAMALVAHDLPIRAELEHNSNDLLPQVYAYEMKITGANAMALPKKDESFSRIITALTIANIRAFDEHSPMQLSNVDNRKEFAALCSAPSDFYRN